MWKNWKKKYFILKGCSICASVGHLACVLHSFPLSVAVSLHNDMSVRLSVALIKKKWEAIVLIIPVGWGVSQRMAVPTPFGMLNTNSNVILATSPSSLPVPLIFYSISLAESLLLIIHRFMMTLQKKKTLVYNSGRHLLGHIVILLLNRRFI